MSDDDFDEAIRLIRENDALRREIRALERRLAELGEPVTEHRFADHFGVAGFPCPSQRQTCH
jgi:hypothetical protein